MSKKSVKEFRLMMAIFALHICICGYVMAANDADIFIAGSDGGYWYKAESTGDGMTLVEKFQDGPAAGKGASAITAGYFDYDNSVDIIIGEENDGWYAPNRWYKVKGDVMEAYYTPSKTAGSDYKIDNFAGKSSLFAGEFFNNGKNQLMTAKFWNGTTGCYQIEGGDDVASSLGDKMWSVRAGCPVQIGSLTGILVCKTNNFELYMPNLTNDGISYTNRLVLPTGLNAIDITAGDFDGDSLIDVFVALDNGTILWYNLNSSYWTSPLATQVGTAFGSNVTAVGIADVNNDGVTELIVASGVAGSGVSTVTWYNPDVNGNPVVVGTTSLDFEVRDMSVAIQKNIFDPIGPPAYNPEGISDVFSLSPNGKLFWYQGFRGSEELSWAGTIASDVFDFAFGDLDNDGLTDIVVSSKTSSVPLRRFEYDNATNSFVQKNAYDFGTGTPKVFIGNLYGGDRDNLFVLFTNGLTYWFKAEDTDALNMQLVQTDPLTYSATKCMAIGYYDKYSLSTEPDIIVARDNGLQWFEYSGGSLNHIQSAWWPSLSGIQSIAMGNFDGNDETDLIYINTQVVDSNSIEGSLVWSEANDYDFPPNWTGRISWENNFVSVGMGDIDGDGKSEVAGVKSDYTVSYFTYMRDAWIDENDNVRRKTMGIKRFGEFDSSSVKILIKSADLPCQGNKADSDLNIDCDVNILDFADIAYDWNTSCYYPGESAKGARIDADLDYDCTVGLTDLSIFVGQWLN